MSTRVRALITAVSDRPIGSGLEGDHASGVTVLTVADAWEFSERGGELYVGGDVYAYDTIDDDTDTVILQGPTTAAYEHGEPVIVLPASTEKVGTATIAGESGSVEVTIPQVWYASIAEQVRTQPVRALIAMVDGSYELVNTYGADKRLLGLKPGDLPPALLTDGIPPATAPTIVAEPFAVAAAQVTITPVTNADPVTYEIAASLTAGVAEDGSDTVLTTPATQARILHVGGVDIPMGSQVWIKVRATDADGAGPWSSEESTVTRTGDDFITAAFIAALEIEAQQIIGGSLLADVAVLGKLAVGGYVDINGDESSITIYGDLEHTIPLVQLRPEGSVFRGQVIADDISVLNGLILLGIDSHISSDAGMIVDDGGIQPPPAPTVSFTTIASTWPAVPSGFFERGITWDGVAGCFLRLLVPASGTIAGNVRVERISTAGASLGYVTLANVPPIGEDDFNSIVRLDSSYYSVVRHSSDGRCRIVKWTAATGAYETMSDDYVTGFYGRVACGHHDESGDDFLVMVGVKDGSPGQLVASRFIYNASTLDEASWLSTTVDWDSGWSKNVMFAQSGGLLGSDAWLTVGAGSVVRFFDNDLVYDAGEAFSLTGSVSPGGVALVPGSPGTWFSVVSGAPLQQYSGWNPDADPAGPTVYAATVGTDGGAGHTMPSTVASATPSARRRYAQVTVTPGATAITDYEIYAATGSTPPTLSALDKRAETVTGLSLIFDPSVAGGAAPPVSSTFPGGDPGFIGSEASPGWTGMGDGRMLVRPPVDDDEAASKGYVDGRHAFHAARSSSLSIANNGAIIAGYTETYDQSAAFNPSTGIFTAPVAGVYHFDASVTWNNFGSTFRRGTTLEVSTDGGSSWAPIAADTDNTTGIVAQSVGTDRSLSAGDQVRVFGFQNSGGSTNAAGPFVFSGHLVTQL